MSFCKLLFEISEDVFTRCTCIWCILKIFRTHYIHVNVMGFLPCDVDENTHVNPNFMEI